jgi:replicative DNA helicase
VRAERADALRTLAAYAEVVDYLQRMDHGTDAGDTYARQVGESAKALKTLARTEGVPVLCLAQLNRQAANTADPPKLSDLRDSGEIEQEADVVVLLQAEPPQPGDDGKRLKVHLHVAKHRNGPCGKVTIDYVRPYTRFEEPRVL